MFGAKKKLLLALLLSSSATCATALTFTLYKGTATCSAAVLTSVTAGTAAFSMRVAGAFSLFSASVFLVFGAGCQMGYVRWDVDYPDKEKESDKVNVRSLGDLDQCLDLAGQVGVPEDLAAPGCHAKYGNATIMGDSAVRFSDRGFTVSVPDARGKRSGSVIQVYTEETRATGKQTLRPDDLIAISKQLDSLLVNAGNATDVCFRVRMQPSTNPKLRNQYTDEFYIRMRMAAIGDDDLTSVGNCKKIRYT